MALTPPNETAFLREVDEEVRKQQLADWLRRYGRVAAGLVVAGLVLFGGVLLWQRHQDDVAGERGEQMNQALREIGTNEAHARTTLQQLSASGVDGYQATARLTLAALALKKNDLRGAAAQYGAIAADTGLAQPFRDLALVRQTAAEFDTLPPQAVVTRLHALAVPGNPWLGSAGEMVALSYIKLNKRDLAGSLLQKIVADQTVPESIRARCQRLAGSIGIDVMPAQIVAGGE